MRLFGAEFTAVWRAVAISATLVALAATGPATAAQEWNTGARVSVYVSGSCCYDGTVIGAGSGSLAGYYLIHFDNPASHDQYAKAANVVARREAGGPAGKGTASPARKPKVRCVMGVIGGKPACLPTAAPR